MSEPTEDNFKYRSRNVNAKRPSARSRPLRSGLIDFGLDFETLKHTKLHKHIRD